MTTSDVDPREAVRAQLLEDAAALSWPQIWQRLASARAELIGATLDVSEAQAVWRPPLAGGAEGADEGEEAWCVAEILRHLITATPNVAAIIEATAQGRTERKGPPGEIAAAEAGIEELRGQLVAVSEGLLSVGLRIPSRANDEVVVEHAFFGPLPSRAWALFQPIHDGMHTGQIRALKAGAGYPAATASQPERKPKPQSR